MSNRSFSQFVAYPWLILINQLLGLMLLSEWIVLSNIGFFSPNAFTTRISTLTTKSAFNFLNTIYWHFVQWLPWISYLVSAVMLIVAVCMILRVYRWVVNWCGAIIAFVYVSAHVTYPGTWLFQYAAFLIFMVIIALSTHHDRKLKTIKEQVIGFHCLDIMPSGLNIIVAFIFSVCVFYFLIVSRSAGVKSNIVGVETAVAFFVLFLIGEVLNRYRLQENQLTKQHASYIAWMNYHWLDYLLMSIGIILVCQVIMDQQLNWFTASGYQNLVGVYAKSSDSPLFIRHFLAWSATQSSWLAPVQASIESFLAIGAVLLIYRFPVALGIFGLCGLLAFSEFGVPSTWPPTAGAETTWTWELLSITLVAGVIALYQLTLWIYAKDNAERMMGEGIFSRLAYWESMLIVFFISISISCYILLTHSLKSLNHAFAIEAGLSCFLFLSLTVAIDQIRKKSDNNSVFSAGAWPW